MVRSMISRDDTWHPRYGVIPGYGITLQDGFQDTFTSTATAALEWGALPYATGGIDNWFKYYIRDNGMVTYRAEELAQSGRMLTILALHFAYTGDTAFALRHYARARKHAEWLLYRVEMATRDHPDPSDPRHGIVAGGDEGDTFVGYYETYGQMELGHKYSCHANVLRGFIDIGAMWKAVGKAAGRADVTTHGTALLAAAPRMASNLEASLNKTIRQTASQRAPRCVPTSADPPPTPSAPPIGCLGDFRGYPELMYAAVLTFNQTDDLFRHLAYGNASELTTRPMTLGCTGYNNKQVRCSALHALPCPALNLPRVCVRRPTPPTAWVTVCSLTT